ncbi:MAG: L-threonylcarbamoyladenylate synthase [Synechococcales cyanobacterium]
MPTRYLVHDRYPQPHTIETIVQQLRQGSLMLYPTDTVYAIGCDLFSKSAVQRVRLLKQLHNTKPLTFLCASLSGIATYAQVSDMAYRLIRALVPGPYTFILPATKLVPKLVQNAKRKTTGIRVPDHPLCQALLQTLGHPLISTSAHWGEHSPQGEINWDAPELSQLANQVEMVVEDGLPLGSQVSTVIDLTGAVPQVVRRGAGYDAVPDWVEEGVDYN